MATRLEKPSLGGPKGDTDSLWGYGRWTGWSAQALLLGYIDQNPLYNAANFNWVPRRRRACNLGGSAINRTVYNSVIGGYLLPIRR